MATTKKTAKRTAAKKATKGAKKTPAKAAKKTPTKKSKRGMSALDAAAKVLGDAKQPMTTKEMIERMAQQGLWKSPGGATPHATLYSAILREVQKKGKDARFKKVERGKFALNG